MPRYMVTDRRTGQRRQMSWSGPTPPTRRDIESFFSAQEEPEPLGFSKLWQQLNEPLTNAPSRAARYVSNNLLTGSDQAEQMLDDYLPGVGRAVSMGRGFLQGAVEGAGDVASSFTSPLSLGLTAATGGASLASRAGLTGVSGALSGIARAGGMGMAGHGLYGATTGDTLADRGAGLVEFAGGLLGARGAAPGRVAPTVEPPPRIAGLLPERNPQTRFYAGEAGIADATQRYPVEMTTRPSLGVADLQGRKKGPTLNNMEIGEMVDLPPEIAAQQGRDIGQPMRPPVMSEFEAAQDALIPNRFKGARPGFRTEAQPGVAYPEVEKPIYNGPTQEKSIGLGKTKKAKLQEKKRIALGIPREQAAPIVEAPKRQFPEIPEPDYPSLSADDLRVQAEAFKDPKAIAELSRRESALASDDLLSKFTGFIDKVNKDERGSLSLFKSKKDKSVREPNASAPLKKGQVADFRAKGFDETADFYDNQITTKSGKESVKMMEGIEAQLKNRKPALDVEDPWIRDEQGRPLALKSENEMRDVRVLPGEKPVAPQKGGKTFGRTPQQIDEDIITRSEADRAAGKLPDEVHQAPRKGKLREFIESEEGSVRNPLIKTEDAPDYGNAFHRKTGHKDFDETAFPNWVNERRASKVEGLLKSREFKDLDGKGVEGIFEFQDNQGQGKFSKLTQYFDEAHHRAEQAGIRMGFKENYLPQLWENSKDEVFQAQRKLGLKPQFTLKSVIENYRKGVEYGLKPKFQNLSDLAGWYEGRLTKAIADRKFFDYLKQNDLIRPKGGAKTPAHWESLDPDHFPINKFITKGKEKDIIYTAEPRVAKAINNYLREPEGLSQKVADFMSVSKNLALSAGVPKTAINAHGFNILHRNQVANGVIRGTIKGVKYMVNPKSAERYLQKNLESAPFAMKHGLTLTTEEHVMGEAGSTNIGHKAFKKLLEVHGKFFEDPLFQKMIPALKLEHFNKSFGELKTKLPERDAARAAAKATNELYGGINWEEMQRDRTLQNWMRAVILAPDWAESNVRIGGGVGKSLAKNTPEGRTYRKVARNLLMLYIGANVANKASSGHWMWENDPGHTFQIEAGKTKEGEKRYISFAGTAADWARLPYDTAAALRKGDLSAATRILKNRTSTGAHALTNVIWNQDNMGRPILGKDTFGRKQSVKKQVGNLTRELAEPVLPQYVQAPIDYAMGRSGKESAAAAAVELPLKYQRTRRKKRGSKSIRVPSIPSVAMPSVPQ